MNINWIEINLSWHVTFSNQDRPKYPDLSKKEKKVFGNTLDKSVPSDKIFNKYHKLFYAFEVDQGFKWNEVAGEVLEQKQAEFFAKYKDNADVIAVIEYRRFKAEIEVWSDVQPEVIEFKKALEIYNKKEGAKSFSGRGLAVPGTLIELEDGSIEFIGSINSSGGTCNDCRAFDDDVIIKRYAVVFEFEKLKEFHNEI